MSSPIATTTRGRTGGCPFAGGAGAPAVVARRPSWIPDVTARGGTELARQVVAAIRRTGKHFLPERLLDQLADARPGTHDRYLAAFLDAVLDKHDGRFQNRTYLALPLIEQLIDDPSNDLDPDRMSALLMADVIRHELRAAEAAPHRGDADDRPDARTLRTRLQHARRFVDHCLGAGADLPTPTGAVAEWLPMTVQPVHVLHDEYFFIRVLQCHEMTFTVLAADMQAATRALREGSPASAAARLAHANEVFARAALLFRIVATMQAATFHAFREFTEGASAIQSDQYKRFEAACGAPHPDRLRSDAFTNVPVVRAEVVAGQDDLARAYLDARRGAAGEPGWHALDAGLRALECSHQRWKTTHRGLAARMLGDASGSGYTSGVPYLENCLKNRLFWSINFQLAPLAESGVR